MLRNGDLASIYLFIYLYKDGSSISSKISSLLQLQKRAVRLIYDLPDREHSGPLHCDPDFTFCVINVKK